MKKYKKQEEMETMTVTGCLKMLPLDTQHETQRKAGTYNYPQGSLGCTEHLSTYWFSFIHLFALLFLSDNKLTESRGHVISNLTMSVSKTTRHFLTHIRILSIRSEEYVNFMA